jgi:GntR family transcriptional regulator / MocR family aminotransferase
MAAELRVSRISVFNAYEQLRSEGYLETFVGSGTCVARSIPDDAFRPSPLRSARVQFEVESRPRKTSARGRLLSKLASEPWLHSLGPFRVSLPALDHFPVNIWSKLIARHSQQQSRSIMAYGDTLGYLPFREAIADYLGVFRGVRCDASQILVTSGSQQALQISAQVLLDPGDELLVEEPGYPGARLAFTSVGVRPVPVAVDRSGMVVEQLPKQRRSNRVVYVTPSHQYPLGMTMDAARRMSLLKWATQSGSWIIEDDYDSEFRFGSRPIASLQGLDTGARVIYIGTFSKVLFPALRIGYMVLPKDLVSFFSAGLDAAAIFSSTLYQAVLTDFIRQGHFARHIRRMRMLYIERRKALISAIGTYFERNVEGMGDDAGMHLVVLLPPRVNDVAVSREAADRGISAMPLSSCYIQSPKRRGLILGYAGVNPSRIREGAQKLAVILKHVHHLGRSEELTHTPKRTYVSSKEWLL